MLYKVWLGESIHNSKKQQDPGSGVVSYNKLRRNIVEFVSLLMEVDCIIHTASGAECVVMGYMMDDRGPGAPIPLGCSSIYLLIYLFLHPERTSQATDLP